MSVHNDSIIQYLKKEDKNIVQIMSKHWDLFDFSDLLMFQGLQKPSPSWAANTSARMSMKPMWMRKIRLSPPVPLCVRHLSMRYLMALA